MGGGRGKSLSKIVWHRVYFMENPRLYIIIRTTNKSVPICRIASRSWHYLLVYFIWSAFILFQQRHPTGLYNAGSAERVVFGRKAFLQRLVITWHGSTLQKLEPIQCTRTMRTASRWFWNFAIMSLQFRITFSYNYAFTPETDSPHHVHCTRGIAWF